MCSAISGTRTPTPKQFKAILAAEIIKALDREHLTVRAAHGRTGIAAADFSRIRNADLGRFTVDGLTITYTAGQQIPLFLAAGANLNVDAIFV